MKEEENTTISSSNKQNTLNRIIAYLKGKQVIETQKDLALILDVNVKNLSSAINGNEKYLTKSLFSKIYEKFPEVVNIDEPAFDSNDVAKYIFDKQTIEGKLSMIFETTVKNNEVLTAKIQDLEDQLRVSQLLNRAYLRSLIVSNKIKKEDIDSAQDLEINIDQKKQSSN